MNVENFRRIAEALTVKACTVDKLVLQAHRLCFQRLEDGTLLLNGRMLPDRKIF